MLEIAFYDGEYDGDLVALTRICEIEGDVVPEGRAPYAPLEETVLLLEMCADKYSTPRPVGACFTVFIGRKAGSEVAPLARLDVYAQNGSAVASVMCENGPRVDSQPVAYLPEDDVVTIVRKIFAELSDKWQLSTLVQSRLKSVHRAVKVDPDDLDDL